MKFDVYFAFKNKDGKWCPGIKAAPMDFDMLVSLLKSPSIKALVDEVRKGDKSRKVELPSICWVGKTRTGRRLAADCDPTQFVMIDVDHVKDIDFCIENVRHDIALDDDLFKHVLCVHKTPSLGLRIVFRAYEDLPRLADQMDWLGKKLELSKYGDFDTAVKDFSRISFLVPYEDFVYINENIFRDKVTFDVEPIRADVNQGDEKAVKDVKDSGEGRLFDNTSVPEFTEEEMKKFDELDYRGTPVKAIVDKYIEVTGQPSTGEIHNFYNELVKNFRCITSNDKRALLYLLPRFGHTIDECWSQIKSICKVNTLSRLEKSFYFFLKDHGFYQPREGESGLKDFMLNSEEKPVDLPPYLPPVFKQLVGSAPKDFVVPAINSLLPIMGTLTSYLKAVYPYDSREHTTSFFSIIYAPPGTGKGFVERFIDILFEDIKLRDFVQSERENVYLRTMQRKGANDKAPDIPHTSLRIIPPKNSEAEFLQKQRDNHGYHMFTYAAEMDSWAKGVRAAGGNKDDMIRIAWDNGEYGQQFKAVNTFKGQTRLFWNVLITGTLQQVQNYFKNVENGLVTRCSFTSIDNQAFALAPKWKKLSKKEMAVIRNFMKRCDNNTYVEPCSINYSDLEGVNDDDFDKEVQWRFNFRERKEVDMSWLMPLLDSFQKEQMAIAAKDVDEARDVFRRRVGVRGFRLGLICMACWENPRPSDLEKCKSFIDWWMHKDMDSMLQLWGAKYNEQAQSNPIMVQRSVYDQLEEQFTKNDVYYICAKQGIKTPIRRIIFDWNKLGYITKIDKEHFQKKTK